MNTVESDLINKKGIIYKITNKLNNMSYIGLSQYTFRERYVSKEWWNSTHNLHLKRSVKKHGPGNFSIEILQENIESVYKLNELEIFYIEKYNSLHPNGYNLNKGGNHRYYCELVGDKIAKIKNKGKIFKFKKLNGEIIKVKNLSKFCKKNNLPPNAMSQVWYGKVKECLGWSRFDINLEEKIFKSPTGELHKMIGSHQFIEFWKNHNLNGQKLALVWNKKQNHYKNWIRFDSEFKLEQLKFKDPSGNLYVVLLRDLNNFCKSKNLIFICMKNVWLNKVNNHKEWHRYDVELVPLKTFKLLNPNNELITLKKSHIKRFCIKNNLTLNGLFDLISNKISSYKGWQKTII